MSSRSNVYLLLHTIFKFLTSYKQLWSQFIHDYDFFNLRLRNTSFTFNLCKFYLFNRFTGYSLNESVLIDIKTNSLYVLFNSVLILHTASKQVRS